MIGDAGQDVGEVGFGIVAVEPGGLGDGVEGGGAAAAVVGAGEEPVFSAQGERADGSFGGIVGHLEAAVGGEAAERRPAGEAVADGASQAALAADRGEGLLEESGELVELRQGSLLAGGQPVCRLVPVDLGLDGEELGDALQRLPGERRAGGGMDVAELAPGMRP